MEQLINVLSKVKNVNALAQTTSLSPEEVKEHLTELETNIKAIRFPRVPNKEDAVNRSQLIEEITIGFVRLEYMYQLLSGTVKKEFGDHVIKRSKEVKKWIG